MASQHAQERRSGVHSLPLSRASNAVDVTRGWAWRIAALATALTATLDLMTGQQIWFGPVYLIIIGFAAWALGWREAIGLGISCIGIALVCNGFRLYPFDGPTSPLDFATRLLSVLVTIALVRVVRQAYEREWSRARTDPLTGALNRQAFFELIAPMQTSTRWSVLAYADLDGLKQLNDRDGHLVGDKCLKTFAQQVGRCIRSDDLFARIGGDEFLLHMFVTDEAAAKAVAERLHSVMNAPAVIDAGVRCSLGVLFLPPGTRSIEDEVRITDELMYEAKERGGSLVAATAREHRGTLYVSRHWEMTLLSNPANSGATSGALLHFDKRFEQQPANTEAHVQVQQTSRRSQAQ